MDTSRKRRAIDLQQADLSVANNPRQRLECRCRQVIALAHESGIHHQHKNVSKPIDGPIWKCFVRMHKMQHSVDDSWDVLARQICIAIKFVITEGGDEFFIAQLEKCFCIGNQGLHLIHRRLTPCVDFISVFASRRIHGNIGWDSLEHLFAKCVLISLTVSLSHSQPKTKAKTKAQHKSALHRI